MERRLLREFQSQVAMQCRFVLIAAEDINQALREHVLHERRIRTAKDEVFAIMAETNLNFEEFRSASDRAEAIVRQRPNYSIRIFYDIQNLLIAAVNINRLLWSSRSQLAEERKPLRDSIGVSDDSP